jgi:hypothetical protein
MVNSMAALSIKAQHRKPPRCPSMGELLIRIQSMHAMESHSYGANYQEVQQPGQIATGLY